MTRPFLRILAWALEGLPERALLRRAAKGIAEVYGAGPKGSLASRVKQLRPAVLVMPTADRAGGSTAAAAHEARLIVPDLTAILLITRRPGAPRAIPDAIALGVPLLCVSSAGELRKVILDVMGTYAISPAEETQINQVVDDAWPESLRRAIVASAVYAHERLNSTTLAARIGVPRRSFYRQLGSAGLPLPVETIRWGGVIRAAVTSWRVDASPFAVARVAGFTDPTHMRAVCASLLGAIGETDAPAPEVVAAALHRRLRQSRRARPRARRTERPHSGFDT